MSWLFKKIIDHRIADSATVDYVGKHNKALVTVVFYSTWKKAIFVLGWRIK
jgi:hypothetical protein